MAQSCDLDLFPILLGDMRFANLPPGLRYGLSTTNCIPFPRTADKPDEPQMRQLLDSMTAPPAGGSEPAASPPPSQAPSPGGGRPRGPGGVPPLEPGPAQHFPQQPGAPPLALVPATCPVLPVEISSRGVEVRRVLAAILSPDDAAASGASARVACCGMGGIGKTTLAAMVLRDVQVRKYFRRLMFVTVGNDPAVLELQRLLHVQLTNEPMKTSADSTAASQLVLLQQAAQSVKLLLVLDDIWSADHTPSLDFVGDESGSRLLVTSRFSGIVPGRCTEIAVGLLREEEAVSLLFKAAQVEERTPARKAAAVSIVKICGCLPLFISLCARLIFEHGADGPWETEVIALLQEDGASILGSHQSGVGHQIVTTSLNDLGDPRTREVFTMMAVLPEDVPVPMQALELIWCASHELEPPLGRHGTMMLRKRAFALLDRSLVLGDIRGLYMHDIVREYCRCEVPEAERRSWQRALVRLLLAATPALGWRAGEGPLVKYVQQSLRHHMAEAIADNAVADTEAQTWLRTTALHPTNDLAVRTASTIFGSEALTTLGEVAEKAGDLWRAGLFFACAYAAEEGKGWLWTLGADDAEQNRKTMAHGLRAAQCFRRIPGSTAEQRTTEFGIRLAIQRFDWTADLEGNQERFAQLLELGIVDTDNPDDLELQSCGLHLFSALVAGYVNPIHTGAHLLRDAHRKSVLAAAHSARLALKIWDHYEGINEPTMQIAGFAGLGGFKPLWSGNIYAFPELIDPTELFSQEFVAALCERYDFETHSTPAHARGFQADCLLWYFPCDYLLTRFGDIGTARAWQRKLIAIFEQTAEQTGRLPATLQLSGVANAVRCACSVRRAAGLGPLALSTMLATQLTYFTVDEVLLDYWKNVGVMEYEAVNKQVALGGPKKLWHSGFAWAADAIKMGHFLVAPAKTPRAEFEAWLPPPGQACVSRDTPESYEIAVGGAHWGDNHLEHDVYEALGLYEAGIEVAGLLVGRFPHNPPLRAECRTTAARCHAALGRGDTAMETFEAAADAIRGTYALFQRLLVHRDASAAAGTAAEHQRQLGLLKAAAAELVAAGAQPSELGGLPGNKGGKLASLIELC